MNLLHFNGRHNFLATLLLALFSLPNGALAQVKIKFDNTKRAYSVGENISLRVASSGSGAGSYELTYDPTNPGATFTKGTFEANGGQDGIINFTVNSPGIVFIRVNQNGSDMKSIAIEPFNIKPLEAEPADFDAFWQTQKGKLAAVPMNPQLSEMQTLPNGSKVYMISLDQIDNRKVWGYLCVPSGGGKFPAVLSLPPFGTSPLQPDQLILTDFAERCGAISMVITAHNVPPNQTDPNAYRPDNLDKRDEYYANYMILACLRAVEYLLSRPDCNGSLGVTGNSQGGGLTATVAGLDSRITAIMPIAAASMEQDGWRFNRASGFPNYARSGVSLNLDSNAVFKNMKYYDAAYFLKRYKGVTMYQTGYLDDLTPAATQFDGYNQNRSKSFFLHMLNRGHDYPFNEYFLGRYAFFEQTLKDFKNYSNFKMTLNIDAGGNKNISRNSTELNGSASIVGGTPSNIRWVKVEGPGTVTFSNNALKTVAQFSQSGTYVLKLMADYDYKLNDEFEPYYYTLADFVTITVGGGNNNPCDTDATPPVFANCPANIILVTQANTATATWTAPTATDNCALASVSSNYASGSSFSFGTTTVTYTATDAKNNRATCSFTVTVTRQNTCDNDTTPPVFVNCPTNINVITQGNAATATWTAPSVSDNCSTPSVSSNFNIGNSFRLGITTVTYTAIDAKNNRTTCSFTVTVTQQSTGSDDCTNYSVGNTNDICSCASTKWAPFGFYFSDTNGCPKEYFIADSNVKFTTTADGSANLKGTFRSINWETVVLNVLYLGKTTIAPAGSPNIIDCTRVIAIGNSSNWQYYTSMTGTIQIGNRPPLSIERRGAAFQMGNGANNQNATALGASGDFSLSDGRVGAFAFSLLNPEGGACAKDLSISLTAENATYQQRTFMDMTVTIKNATAQVFKDIVVSFPFPTGVVTGGTVSPSAGLWKEWCSGNVHCFNWDISTLAANGMATLKVPMYIQDINTPILLNAKIISSTPTDNDLTNNEAMLTLLLSADEKTNLDTPSAQRPLILDRVSPNPTENEIVVDYRSVLQEKMSFQIVNTFGEIVKILTRNVLKGRNSLYFDVSDLSSGLYYIVPNSNTPNKVKLKFVKY